MKNSFHKDVELLYRQYYGDVFRYVSLIHYVSSDIEDIVQNTFLKAMRGIAGFRGDSSIRTWLFTIARNESIHCSKKKRGNMPIDNMVHLNCGVNIDEAVCNKEAVDTIFKYMKRCDEPKRSLLALRLIGEQSFVEIGKILGKSDTWCRVTFMRAKNEIISKLEELDTYE